MMPVHRENKGHLAGHLCLITSVKPLSSQLGLVWPVCSQTHHSAHFETRDGDIPLPDAPSASQDEDGSLSTRAAPSSGPTRPDPAPSALLSLFVFRHLVTIR